MPVINCCKLLYFNLILLSITGVSNYNPSDYKLLYIHSTVFVIQNAFNLFKRTNTEKFVQWETEINKKIKKEQYEEVLAHSKKIEEAAIKINSEYWLCVSYYYYAIGTKYIKDYKTSLSYFLKIINNKNNPFSKETDRQFNVFRHMADVYKKLSAYAEAISYYKKSIELKDKLTDKKILVPSYVNLGSIYSSLSKFADARECYFNGLASIKENNDYMAAVIYNNLGNDEYSQGYYFKATEYYMNSIQISEKNNDWNRLALAYNNLGSIYTQELKDLPKAFLYYTKSLDIEKKRGNEDGIATELNNIGNVLTLQLKFTDAERSFENALHLFRKINNSEGIARTFEYLGALYSKSGNYNKAIAAFTKCIEIRTKNNNEINFDNVYNSLAAVYFYQKEYQKSLQFYFKALELAKLKNDKSMIKRVYCGIHEAYAKLGNYDKAYKYLQDYSNLKDTLLNATISKQIIDIQEKYEKNKMEQKVALQNLEIKNKSLQRNGILAFLILSIIIFSSALYIIFQKRKNERLLYNKNTKIKDQEIKNLIQHSEIKSMASMAEGQEQERQSISRELHDRVGSMLSLIKLNLSNYEEGNSQIIKETQDLLDNTYEEVRNISHNLHSGLLTQFGLRAALNDLKYMIEAHNSMRVNLLFHETELVLPKETEIVVFKILQELVTNALKHSEAKNLDIQINYSEDAVISITVEDDGRGFDVASKNKEGIGLNNIRYRITSIGGSLEISSDPGKGACFIMNIPIPVITDNKVIS